MSADDDPTAWIRQEGRPPRRPPPRRPPPGRPAADGDGRPAADGVGRPATDGDRHDDGWHEGEWHDDEWHDDEWHDDEDTARIAAGRPPVPGSERAGRNAAPVGGAAEHGFGRALLLTVVGAVLPGTALLAAGRRRLGWAVLMLFVVLLAAAAWLATEGRRTAVRLAVDPGALLVLMVALVALAVGWVLLVVAGYRLLAPARTTSGQHVLGGLLVVLLGVGIALPAFEAARLAAVQRGLISGLFAEDGESATVSDPANAADPFGDQQRVNVLLLGGDGGEGRDGVRTDTVIVASIDTDTGLTTLFSLPRNLEDLPFPADSPLGEVYPDGFDAGSESESLLNAVYRNGPAAHPDILGPTDNPGADFLKLGVGEALGLTIDFYVLVNLEGFSRLVDALGGITVNVNYYVPVGGEPTLGILPDDYIAPGPDQRLDGVRALDYARGRFGLTDYDRMDRQRCTLDAILAAANPITLLRQYQELAATTQDIVQTDIPQSVLDDFVDLAFLVQEAGVRSVVFDDTVITPAYPDYDEIRLLVQQALGTSAGPDDAPSPTIPAPSASTAPTPVPAPSSASSPAPVDDVADACAYDRVAAQEALDAGEPPTRRR